MFFRRNLEIVVVCTMPDQFHVVPLRVGRSRGISATAGELMRSTHEKMFTHLRANTWERYRPCLVLVPRSVVLKK